MWQRKETPTETHDGLAGYQFQKNMIKVMTFTLHGKVQLWKRAGVKK